MIKHVGDFKSGNIDIEVYYITSKCGLWDSLFSYGMAAETVDIYYSDIGHILTGRVEKVEREIKKMIHYPLWVGYKYEISYYAVQGRVCFFKEIETNHRFVTNHDINEPMVRSDTTSERLIALVFEDYVELRNMLRIRQHRLEAIDIIRRGNNVCSNMDRR